MATFNTRCNNCNSVITKHDVKCYVCGEPVEANGGFFAWLRRAPEPPKANKTSSAMKSDKATDSKRFGSLAL